MNNTVVFITALPCEYRAVAAYLTQLQEEPHPEGTLYEVGNYQNHNVHWRVAVVETGQGNPKAALETERAISHFKPAFAFFVGVAGGIKDDVALGDVVAAEVIKGYERGKGTAKSFLPRGEIGKSSYPLVQQAKVTARRQDWLAKIKVETRNVNAIVAPIAAGEQVVASRRSAVYKFLTQTYSDTVAVEMEGIGFLTAIEASSTPGIVIRGISDLLVKTPAHDKKWQTIAAQNAAAFAFAILDRLDSKPAVLYKLKKLEDYKEYFSEADMAILRREIFIKYF